LTLRARFRGLVPGTPKGEHAPVIPCVLAGKDGAQTTSWTAAVDAPLFHLFARPMPVSLQRLRTALQQPYPAATARVLADVVEHLHPASPLSPSQQQQFRRCCAHLVAAATPDCPTLLLAADVCFNYAYALPGTPARACPHHSG
jgi:hypothetical protein